MSVVKLEYKELSHWIEMGGVFYNVNNNGKSEMVEAPKQDLISSELITVAVWKGSVAKYLFFFMQM